MFKKIMRVILSKTFAFALLLFVQVGFFVVLINEFAKGGAVAYWVLTIVIAIILLVILEQDNLNPAYKLMWVVLIVILPASGALFYLLWGHRTVPKRKQKILQQIEDRANSMLQQDPAVLAALEQRDSKLAQSAYYLSTHAYAPIYPATGREQYYPIGEDFFPVFLRSIENAKKFIFMEYYIYEEGYMLETTIEALRKKAAEGVDVRVLWDGFGSLFTLPPGYDRKLRALGIKCFAYSPLELTPHISDYAMLNHRDHRKITSIDGEIAFSGGLNFADEYINVKKRFGEWKDTAFMVQGEAAYSLTVTFLRAWDFASGTISNFTFYRPAALLPLGQFPPPEELSFKHGFVQPYCDSPLDNENVSENAYLNVIRHAINYVYISTPYLILDNEMITSLSLAAKSGVDVRILTPGIPDKPTIFLVTQSYYPVLLQAGVRIFEYTPGFNHAKMYVSDDNIAIIGSANMDYRSLYLHFENCVSFYGGHVVDEAKQDMLHSFAQAHEVHLDETKQTNPVRRLIQVIAKFFSPLL